MSNSCRPIFPATAYAGDDPIKMEFAKLYRPHSTDHKSGMKATDLIVLTRTPNYTDPKKMTDFLEDCSLGTSAPLVDWGPTDEPIIEELAIATFMVPEILHDDDYEWDELYITSTTQGERGLREQISLVHFPCETEARNLFRSCGGMSEIRPPNGEWTLVSAEGTKDRELSAEERDNEEWNECLELSYFAEYDQSTDKAFFIVDNKGLPTAHNAERHEQRSALNALWNHPEMDLKVKSWIEAAGRERTRYQEVVEKTNVLDECGIHAVECQLIATGDNFAAAVCRYGGIFVPRKCQSLIGDGGDFTARLTISTEGAKYPLRVAEINRC